MATILTFRAARATGLLWAINRTLLHPRGFVLALAYPPDAEPDAIFAHAVDPIGLVLTGDGTSPVRFEDDTADDDGYDRVEALLAAVRLDPSPLPGPGVASCRVCGCTADSACPGGCHWVRDPTMKGDLCSTCLPLVTSGLWPDDRPPVPAELVELLAELVHESWLDTTRARGIESRLSESGEELMVPYDDLSDDAKNLDRGTVRTILHAVAAIAPDTGRRQ